ELDRALHQVVRRLLGDETERVPPPRDLVRTRDVPPGEVGRADVENLALTLELLHRLPDLVPPRLTVDVVHLVKIDPVDEQPPEDLLALSEDALSRPKRFV